MKNITNIYIVLSFFVYLILSSIIFLEFKDICLYIEKKKSIKLREEYKTLILKHLQYTEHNKKISQIEINNIKDLLKKKLGMRIFNDTIIEYNEINKNYDVTKKYVSNFENELMKQFVRYKRKDEIIKNYMVFILGEYRVANYEINKFLIECLTTKSVYLTISALRTIAKLGNANQFIEALKVISKNKKIINNKILNDILDQYSGDVSELNNIMNSYYDFSESIQKSIVEYFKKNKNESFKYTFLQLLQSDVSKEVKISIIKYFGVIKSEKAKTVIISILENEEWEYRAVCANTLSNYIDDDTKNAMLKSIKDKNWYVRYNSAMCLLDFDNKEIIDAVLESKDKYAIDILNYAMSIKNKTNKEIEVYSYA